MINQASILLFGETGVGKSSLGNLILNEPNAFSISDKPESETKVTCGKFNEKKDIFIIDTPGIQDSEGKDKEHVDQMIDFIKSHKNLKVILIVFNYCENEEKNELSKSNKTNLEIIKNIFKDVDIGKHIGIFFTHFYQNETDEKTKEEKESFKKKEINKIINSSENDFPCFYGNIINGKEARMETNVEILRIIKWAKSLEPIDVKQANQNATEKNRRKEKNIQHKVEMEGDYIIEYDLVKTREIITYFDNTIKECPWSEPEKINERKKLNEELIKKKEEEKKEKERKEQIEKEKREENERRKREEKELKRKINSVSVSDYYEPPSFHRTNNFGGFGVPSIPIYRREFAGGRGQFSINIGGGGDCILI